MPLVQDSLNQPKLVCINEGCRTQDTRMQYDGWHALVVAQPPVIGTGARLDLDRAAPVRMFVCGKCGYVELYLASKVAPGVWEKR